MDSICEGYFKKKLELRIESFEKETLLGLIEIIDKMHKKSIEDYKNVINNHFIDENGKIIDSLKFEKVCSEQFHLMFFNIAEEFKHRLRTLKRELIKKLNVKKIKMKELKATVEENESFGKPDPKSDNESIKKIMEYINSNSKDTAEDTASSMMKRE